MGEHGEASHYFESIARRPQSAMPERQEVTKKIGPESESLRLQEAEGALEALERAPQMTRVELGMVSWRKQTKDDRGQWVDKPGPNEDQGILAEELRLLGVADGDDSKIIGEVDGSGVTKITLTLEGS